MDEYMAKMDDDEEEIHIGQKLDEIMDNDDEAETELSRWYKFYRPYSKEEKKTQKLRWSRSLWNNSYNKLITLAEEKSLFRLIWSHQLQTELGF